MTEKAAGRVSIAFKLAGSLLILLALLTLSSCSRHNGSTGKGGKSSAAMDSTLVISMLGDADYLNPVIGATVTSSNIFGLIYPSLLQSEFDTTTGLMNYMALEKKLRAVTAGQGKKAPKGAIAKSWRLSDDHTSLTYILRSDAFWDDGKPIVSADFKFSYQLYGNPVIASARQQYLAELVGADKG